jgi:nucleoside-diphosphate-sugar epimerase
MRGKRVVFTGGSGKAGRHVLPHLESKGYDLLNVDLKPFDHPGISILIADLTHGGQAFNAVTTHFGFDRFEGGRPPAAPDVVVHFAPRVLIEPDNETFRVNTIRTYNVIEAAVKLGVRKIVSVAAVRGIMGHASAKNTFGEMRSGGGPTGILMYCADYRCSHSIEMSAEVLMTCGCRISSRGSSARLAASAALTCGQISSQRGWDPRIEVP